MIEQNMSKSVYLFLIFIILVLSGLGIVSNTVVQKNSLEHNAYAKILNYNQQFQNHIKSETLMLESFVKLLSENKQIQSLFTEANKEELFNATEKIYHYLNKNNDITHLYFIKKSAKVLLRVHDFKRDADTIKRHTFLEAQKSQKLFSGLEFGIKKNYTLRVVYPWMIEGELVGYIEIGKEIDKIIKNLSSQLAIEIAIGVDKEEYKNSAEFVHKRLEAHMHSATQFIVYLTLPQDKKILPYFDGVADNKWLFLGEKNYIAYRDTLEDVSGKKLGSTLFLVDITSEYDELKLSLYLYIFVMFIGTLFMLLLGYFFVKKKQAELDTALLKIDDTMREKSSMLSLFEHGDSVLFKWNNDEKWSTEYVSSNVSNLLGYTNEEFVNAEIIYAECIHQDDIANVIFEVNQAKESSENFFKHTPYRILTKDKAIKWVLDYTVLVKNKDEKTTHFLGYIIDITERENILKNLEKFIDTQNNIVILSDGKKIKFANKQFYDFFNYENLSEFKKNHECICEYFIENERFFHLGKVPEDSDWLQEMQKLIDSKRVVGFYSVEGTEHIFSVHINKFEDSTLIVSFTDISGTMLNQKVLEDKTLHDTLTGAYNREYFEQNYKRFIAEAQEENLLLGVALLDIDHFKLVNDTYGHDVGDSVLIEFVNIVQMHSRDSDVLVRWGGEEFVLLFKIKEQYHLQNILENIRRVIQEHSFTQVGAKTCSIGATLYKEAEDIQKTIKRADEAVYMAKERGRNLLILQ